MAKELAAAYGGMVSQVYTHAGNIMEPGEYLSPGDEVTSESGDYHLVYQQSDGNLVLYDANWSAVWDAGTQGTSLGFVAMQTDGNLVRYDGGGVARFNSGTSGYQGARLVVENEGRIAVYLPFCSLLWSAGQ